MFSLFTVPVRDPDQCKMDADCSSKLACFSGVCKNPCYEAKPCAEHAVCTVQDTLPLRTMYCVCEEGYVGDAEKQCLPGLLDFKIAFERKHTCFLRSMQLIIYAFISRKLNDITSNLQKLKTHFRPSLANYHNTLSRPNAY